MHKKQPKDFPEGIGRKPYAWGGWMLLLIVLGWLLFAWIGSGILVFVRWIFS